MSELTIPISNLQGLRDISLFSNNEVNNLYEILRKLPKAPSYTKFSKFLSEASLPIDDTESISRAIFSLGSLLTNNDFTIEILAQDLTRAYLRQQEDDLLIDFNQNLFEERMRFILLSINSLKLTFQAYNIVATGNNVIRRINISTDIRMIFEDNFKSKNGILIHSLNIVFDSDGDSDNKKSFTLDSDDLKSLKAQIESVLVYEENIRVNNQGSINFIDLTE